MDASEISAILSRYERPLVRYAHGFLGDLESARDVVQETFIRLVQRGRPVETEPSEPERHLAAWLFTVTRNLSIDHQRRTSRIIPMPVLDDRADERAAPDAELESRDAEASLLGLLDALSENQRDVIRLKFQNDLSYQEIAEVTGLTVGNVGFLLHTGLRKLRAMLTEQPREEWPAPVRQAV